MASPLLASAAPSAHDLQSHLYLAFLQGRTADVALRIRGSWQAVYNLHRVVLIQSGFFRSLFTAGFSESLLSVYSHHSAPEQIDLVFDDRNITRAAFEVCISRLYGGGPPLYIPPCLIPSTTQPLSPSFYEGFSWGKGPDNHHPAAPRFLLSLLATATFLSIPTVAAQALSCILRTIGPHTVIQYLNFALGQHIGPPDDADPDAAVGLEHVAQLSEDSDRKSENAGSEDSDQAISSNDIQVCKENPTDSSDEESGSESPLFYYGAVSDKIGEACACWLARWGSDILDCEELLEGMRTSPSSSQPSATQASLFVKRYGISKNPIPPIWRRGGLGSKWAATLLGADTLFVRGECERYELARRVVELRRRSGILQEEEAEWLKAFEYGIYYETMAMEDIIKISHDVSVTTKRPFVPLHVLQAALWRHSVMRQHIMSASSSISSRPSSFEIEKEIGIIHTTSELDLTAEDVSSKTYFPVFEDSSSRLGDSGNLLEKALPLTMDELYEHLRSPAVSHPVSSPKGVSNENFRAFTPQTQSSYSTYFGLAPLRFTPSACVQRDVSGKQKWSPYPPCRFAIEFWDLDFLKEKARLYSQTIWYAGSLFNVYMQIVRKKEQVQLGIYLHRQSTVDPVPSASIPSPLMCSDSANAQDERDRRGHAHKLSTAIMLMPRTPPAHFTSPSIRATPDTVSSLPSSPVIGGASYSPLSSGLYALPATGNTSAPRQTYRDPRSSISAYFAVSLASSTGSSQTRFRSSPDVFGISKSWGWKTSSLRTDEYMEVRDENTRPRTTPYGSEVSLRATVVLGLV